MTIDAEEIERWGGELGVLQARLGGYFQRSEPRQRAIRYLQGLMSDLPHKNGWQLAEQAGEMTPDGMQRLLNQSVWSAEAVRDELQGYVGEQLGSAEGVLVVDETGFLKKGEKSVGVQRQYSGTAGRIENCQVGVFAAYASPQGHVLLDRELYLPKAWAEDEKRREEGHVPAEVSFMTKPELAQQMVERVLQAGIPCAWVTGDTSYGGDAHFRAALESRHQAYVLAVAKNETLWSGPRQIQVEAHTAALPVEVWQRLSAGDGAKGPRLYDWALMPLALHPGTGMRYGVLARRSLSDVHELAYYAVYAPVSTTLPILVHVVGQRWKVEECFELAKQEVGLDEYEVRHWTGWFRHITLAMWALAFLVVTRSEVVAVETKKAPSPAGDAALVPG
jgi:SRSO17 transposase